MLPDPIADRGMPPDDTCTDCPDPARCKADGCHGMDGVDYDPLLGEEDDDA